MSDEIISSLGFSVEDALTALQRLDRAFADTLTVMAKSLTVFNTQTASTVKALNSIEAAAKRAQSAMSNVKTPAGTTMPTDTTSATAAGMKVVTDETTKADNATKGLLISWQTMSRVVVTQLIVRTLSQIRNALGDAITGAIEFQKSIAEIRTIAPAVDKDFSNLGKEVASFSTKFNFPLPQAAEAVYQTLSNQFTTASERADIMKASAELAKVGVMSLSDAVLLITGTLNAYGKSSGEAEAVASKFFKTIELGRVRGEELVQVVGKLMPMASALGVSLDEVNSSMVGLTIGGMKSSEASTALRGAMTALIKPSEALKKEMKSINGMSFESGPQMITALGGIQETMLALGKSADGDVAKLATFFRQVRGLNAVLRDTGPGAKKVAEAMEAMKKSTPENLQAIYKEFRSTDAEKFTSALNDMKVYLSTELGPELLKILNSLTGLAGGTNNLKAALTGLLVAGASAIVIMAVIAAKLTGVSIATRLVSLGAKSAAVSTTMLGAAFKSAVLPISILIGVVALLNEKLASSYESAADAAVKSFEATEEKRKNALASQKAEQEKQDEKQLSMLGQYAGKLRKSYMDSVEVAAETNKDLIGQNKMTMEAMISDRERLAGVYRSVANSEIQEAKKASRAGIDSESEYADSVFNFAEKRKSAYEKVQDYTAKAAREGGIAAQEASKTGIGPEAHSEAMARLAKAQADAQTAMQAAGNDSYLQEQAQSTQLSLIRMKGDAEKKYAGHALESSKAATKAAADEQSHVDSMKKLMPEILKDMDMFKKGAPKSAKERTDLVAKTKEDIKEFQKEWLKSGQVSTSGLLNWTDLKEKLTATMEGGVSDVAIQGFIATPASLEKLNAQISGGVKEIEILIKAAIQFDPELKKMLEGKNQLEALDYLTGNKPKSDIEARNKAQATNDQIKSSNRAIDFSAKMLGAAKEAHGIPEAGGNPMAWIAQAAISAQRLGSLLANFKSPQELNAQWSSIQQTFDEIAKTPALATMDKLAEQQKKIANIKATGGLSAWDETHLEKSLAFMTTIVSEQEKLKTNKVNLASEQPEAAKAVGNLKGITELPQVKSFQQQHEKELQDFKAEQERAKNALQNPNLGNKVTTTATGADTLASNLKEAASVDFSSLINQLTEVASAMSSTAQQPQMASHGGMMYLASGGRGTDTIAAMLSPGEMVMNAAASNKFATQLSSMNAGITPNIQNNTGNTTNVGDISINVNGNRSPQQTAREVMSSMRREFRRGTGAI